MNKAKWIVPAVLLSSLVAGVALAKGNGEAPRLFDRVEQNEKGNQDRTASDPTSERMANTMAKKDTVKRRAGAAMHGAERAQSKAKERRGENSEHTGRDKKDHIGGEQLFEKLDANHDGTITSNEAGRKATGWLRKLDTNDDGAVTLAEMRAAKSLGHQSHAKRGKGADRDQNEKRSPKHETRGKGKGDNKSKKR